jgi:polysaccharide export outer membrane protein
MNIRDRKLLRGSQVAALLALLVAATPPSRGAETTPEFVIGVEDVLQILMPDHPELSVTVPVRPDGRISLPLVDDVEAAGISPDQLKSRLVEAYRAFVTIPNISVLVQEIHSLKVYVLGEVTAPGVFDLQRPARVLQVIALAGGFTQYAEKNRVVVLREVDGAQERLEINLKRVYSGDAIEENILLKPGDTLVVP